MNEQGWFSLIFLQDAELILSRWQWRHTPPSAFWAFTESCIHTDLYGVEAFNYPLYLHCWIFTEAGSSLQTIPFCMHCCLICYKRSALFKSNRRMGKSPSMKDRFLGQCQFYRKKTRSFQTLCWSFAKVPFYSVRTEDDYIDWVLGSHAYWAHLF